jgi:hypothetical protein
MKKLFLAFALLIAAASYAQQGSKPAQKEKAPTQKEMAEMMKELENMSPEDKKMMEQMGIKMPDVRKMQKDMAGVSDKQLADAWEEENRLVPLRDAVRIASIAAAVTDARIKTYIAAIHGKYSATLDKEISAMGDQAYECTRKNNLNGYKAGNIAIGFWIKGKPQTALYIMGKICMMDGDLDNRSNYAAMLSMMGGEHLAIPLLNNLNGKFPKNSTLLNNLGQAWFGLGEINKAEKYLDSAIRFFGYHPQANFTKSLIQESKDHSADAVRSMKNAIHNNYSEEKDERLRKLGYKLDDDDVHFPSKPDPDPLGFGNFGYPDFPTTAELEVGLKEVWAEYRQKLDEKIESLTEQARAAQEVMAEKAKDRLNYAKSIASQSMAAGRPVGNINPMPIYIRKASLKLKALEKTGGTKTVYENHLKKLSNYWLEIVPLKKQYDEDMAKIAEEDLEQTGEGKPNKDYCEVYMKRVSQYLKECNIELQARTRDYLAVYKQFYGEQLYWMQYAQWPDQFEVTKLTYQVNWLRTLRDLKYEETGFFDNRPLCITREEDEEQDGDSILANFDDVACKYKSVMNLGVWKFTNNCSQMISEFDVKFIQYSRTDDFNRAEGDTYIKSTLKFAVEKGFDATKIERGPLKAEAKIGAGVEIEMDRTGVKDVIISAEAKAGVGTNVIDKGLEEHGSIGGKDMIDTTVEIGIETKVSIMSGKGSVKGTGKLENITVKEW